ncbi:MAG: glycoside hydrolase family 28 protein [Paludibacteraceae bacterium]|nr:glycoside hydrolase family 28 protein [Paludibacteraceae bacterium]
MKKLLIVFLSICGSLSLFAEKQLDVSNPWDAVNDVLKNIKDPEFNKDRVFNILDFGAKPGVEDYKINAINSAINACSQKGGGIVLVPKGIFYTGPITLKSNVNLHLEDGAVIRFSTNPSDYEPFVLTRWEGWDCINFHPLIYAYGETNVAITGKGTLDGQANNYNWWPWKGKKEFGWKEGMTSQEWNRSEENGGRNRLSKMEEDNVPCQKRIMTQEDCLRPTFVEPYNCKNVLLEGFTLINSPFWCLHPFMSENVTVRGVTVSSHGPNNDGCDPESCKNVLIEKCSFNTGDDCIAIKSGKNNDGRRWDKPSENIVIRNCEMKDGHGGVVLGSEISGNVRNVWVENCTMNSPELDRVIRIKSNPIRGGKLENFFIRNIKVGQCAEAVFRVEMKYEKVVDGPNMPLVKNFIIENVNCGKSRYGVYIDGFDKTPQKQVTGITFKNCIFNNVATPYKIVGAENIVFDNVLINGEKVNYQEK